MKSCASSEECEVNLRTVNTLRKDKISRNSAMTTKTKDFIQKICYRKTASIDMTQYGFINDSKLNPVNLMLKPLRAQLEKICGKPSGDASLRKKSPVRKKKVKVNRSKTNSSPRTSLQMAKPSKQKSPRARKSALSPGPRPPHTRVRKVRIQIDPSPTVRKKKVRLVLPASKKKKK